MKILKRQYNKKFRLSIFKSNKHIYAQLIDDQKSQTLAASSTIQKNIRILLKSKKDKAYLVGQDIGLKIFNLNISNIFFERGNKKYYGLITSLANGVKYSGLKI